MPCAAKTGFRRLLEAYTEHNVICNAHQHDCTQPLRFVWPVWPTGCGMARRRVSVRGGQAGARWLKLMLQRCAVLLL